MNDKEALTAIRQAREAIGVIYDSLHGLERYVLPDQQANTAPELAKPHDIRCHPGKCEAGCDCWCHRKDMPQPASWEQAMNILEGEVESIRVALVSGTVQRSMLASAFEVARQSLAALPAGGITEHDIENFKATLIASCHSRTPHSEISKAVDAFVDKAKLGQPAPAVTAEMLAILRVQIANTLDQKRPGGEKLEIVLNLVDAAFASLRSHGGILPQPKLTIGAIAKYLVEQRATFLPPDTIGPLAMGLSNFLTGYTYGGIRPLDHNSPEVQAIIADWWKYHDHNAAISADENLGQLVDKVLALHGPAITRERLNTMLRGHDLTVAQAKAIADELLGKEEK